MSDKDKPRVWGGFGEKKSNSGRQWYIQDRVYDSDYVCPSLTAFKSDYWIVIRIEKDVNDNMISENCKDCTSWDAINNRCLVDCACLDSVWESYGDDYE